MKTKKILIQGVLLEVPIQYVPPHGRLDSFKNCCGAGDGWGEKLVPDTIWGLNISCACHIHDFSWEIADATTEDFKQTNTMFINNIRAIIDARSANSFMRSLRSYRAVTYYLAVEELGDEGFWELKEEQGLWTPPVTPPVFGEGDSY